jgi:hypothetical protein
MEQAAKEMAPIAGCEECEMFECMCFECRMDYEQSLYAKIKAGDKAGQEQWVEAAKAGQIMRIC